MSHLNWHKKPHHLGTFFLFVAFLVSSHLVAQEFHSLSDQELSEETGQALFSLSQSSNSGVNFYKLAMNAKVDINANVSSLQLGCNGVNGSGCDIDISNLSLSGGNGVGSDLSITKPFIEFAITNDNNPATRSISGFRVSGQNMSGVLQAGQNLTYDGGTSSAPNGFNAFSGRMVVQGTGYANTSATNIDQGRGGQLSGPVTSNVTITGLLSGGGRLSGRYDSSSYNLNIPRITGIPFTLNPTALNFGTAFGNKTTANLNVTTQAVGTNYSGTMNARAPLQGGITACAAFICLPINVQLTANINNAQLNNGYISNIVANVPISQHLGTIHKINVNNPFSISLQNQAISWPGLAGAAQRGWWMEFGDVVNLGSLTPGSDIPLDQNAVSQIMSQVRNTLSYTNIDTNVSLSGAQAIGGLLTGSVDINNLGINMPSLSLNQALNMTTQNNLYLPSQGIIPNCFGRTFC
jgi:hypothetical protein